MLQRLLENWSLKLLSVVIALLLWAFLMGEQRVEVGYTVPLELMNVPDGLMVANDVPSLVDLRLSGPRTRLAALNVADLRVTLDLKKLTPGVTAFRRLEDKLSLPSGVRVVRLAPSTVEVKLEKVGHKLVRVKVVTSGEPAPGYTVARVEVKPKKVTVVGAQSELKGVHEVETDPIELSGIRESFHGEVPLHHAGSYTRLDPIRQVDVAVVLRPPPAKAPAKAPARQSEKKEGTHQ